MTVLGLLIKSILITKRFQLNNELEAKKRNRVEIDTVFNIRDLIFF